MEIQLPEHNQTPHEIVQALDSYIIGQSDAKKSRCGSPQKPVA